MKDRWSKKDVLEELAAEYCYLIGLEKVSVQHRVWLSALLNAEDQTEVIRIAQRLGISREELQQAVTAIQIKLKAEEDPDRRVVEPNLPSGVVPPRDELLKGVTVMRITSADQLPKREPIDKEGRMITKEEAIEAAHTLQQFCDEQTDCFECPFSYGKQRCGICECAVSGPCDDWNLEEVEE